MDDLYLIQTTLGNSILPASTKALVHLADGSLFNKCIDDLVVGEQVAFAKEGIDKELKDIEPFLIQSPRYKDAIEALYLPDGRTRLQVDLQNNFELFEANIVGVSFE